jgi:hypothetical protein
MLHIKQTVTAMEYENLKIRSYINIDVILFVDNGLSKKNTDIMAVSTMEQINKLIRLYT